MIFDIIFEFVLEPISEFHQNCRFEMEIEIVMLQALDSYQYQSLKLSFLSFPNDLCATFQREFLQ